MILSAAPRTNLFFSEIDGFGGHFSSESLLMLLFSSIISTKKTDEK